MKTFRIHLQDSSNYNEVLVVLQKLSNEGIIKFQETDEGFEEAESATEDQVREIIDESEIGPYYSEQEAKQILNL